MVSLAAPRENDFAVTIVAQAYLAEKRRQISGWHAFERRRCGELRFVVFHSAFPRSNFYDNMRWYAPAWNGPAVDSHFVPGPAAVSPLGAAQLGEFNADAGPAVAGPKVTQGRDFPSAVR
jgi:hypothetical protein